MHMANLLRKILRPKLLIAFTVLIIGGILANWWHRYNQAPAVGIVRTSVTTSKPESRQVSSGHFKGDMIAFDYPSSYTSVESKSAGASAPISEQYTLNQPGMAGSNRISITVKSLSGSSMLEDSAYQLRTVKANEYEISDETISDRTIKKSVRKDGTEVTYFFPGEKAYAIIAATSSNPTDDFKQDVSKLVDSFAWVR
jgi:hypothetical protein